VLTKVRDISFVFLLLLLLVLLLIAVVEEVLLLLLLLFLLLLLLTSAAGITRVDGPIHTIEAENGDAIDDDNFC
jgi:hypothetical protein